MREWVWPTAECQLREVDLPGLYERDCLVVLPAINAPGAGVAAERLLAAFRGSHLTRAAKTFEIAINVGLTTHPGGEGISVSGPFSGASTAP